MAKITDPDLLNKGTEIIFDSGSRRIQLVEAGNLSSDGVTLQAIYSKCKELWRTDETLVKYPFPLISITEKKFDMIDSWNFSGSATKQLIRDAGWSVKNTSNASTEEYMGFITLGTIGSSDQVNFQQSSSGASSNTIYTGPVNEPVQIYSASVFDYRDYFKTFVRIQGKTYDTSQLSAIGETTVTYQVYSFPLTNTTDVKITHADSELTASLPYASMSIYYYTASIGKTIGSGVYQFTVVIDGNSGTKEQIYEFVQYKLRQNENINSGSGQTGFLGDITGNTADELLSFVGDTLRTEAGVFIEDFATADTNNIEFYDTGSNSRTYPYVAAGTLAFNTYLTTDPSASYKMFFTSVPSGSFGSSSAVIVNNNNGNPITGSVNGSSSISFDFDYDNNVQGGRTAGTDANVTVVGIGLSTGQYVSAAGTLARSTTNAISLVAALERNYRT